MKIVTIIGARPQFIKAAAVSRALRKYHKEVLVHTGQHYDTNMSDIFFKELEIPKPDYNLGVGSGSHARQTSEMMIGIEKILIDETPHCVLVYGDTNSTLAGALTASKLKIPVIHVEAGLRSYNMNMPEEINRILTDRISRVLFCPTKTAVSNLREEGIHHGIYYIGDVMCDAVLYYSNKISSQDKKEYIKKLQILYGDGIPNKWYLATLHRAENTESTTNIAQVLSAFEELAEPVIFPVHPRTRKMVLQLCTELHLKNVLVTEPIGYLEMLYFTKNAIKVITDSGGLQKEAYILHTPCVTIREQTEWVETLSGNYNILAHPLKEDVLRKVNKTVIGGSEHSDFYGNGNAAEQLCRILQEEAL